MEDIKLGIVESNFANYIRCNQTKGIYTMKIMFYIITIQLYG